ncbi:hypothetical protein BGW41_000788 [Actinomortierella wolfii]|nr:hypothetical protein BGW41_000788 [Actinomortierella wolfii]
MNFFFPSASSSTTPSSSPLSSTPPKFSAVSHAVQAQPLRSSPSTASSLPSHTPASSAAATGISSTNLPDIDLSIEVEPSFHGILLGVPEESPGAVFYVTIVLHVRRKPIRASKLQATFDGRIKVQCSDAATFGHEQHRERVLAHRNWTLWEASSNTNVSTGGESKNHIPVGTHYYPLSIQLDGALPPSFSGKHGSVRYFLSADLMRPLFYSDIHTVHELPIGRCLVPDEGCDPQSSLEEGVAPGLSLLPGIGSNTTITHHNTHKELLRYTASSPPIAFLDHELIQLDLALEPLPPGSRIHSISYGLKEIVRYHSSTSGNAADNKCEILYPLGQQTVIIPRDLERERAMSSAGAGASTRQLLELRTNPDLVNVDMVTSLIDVQHRLTCNVAVVLEDPAKRANSNADADMSASDSRKGDASISGSGRSDTRAGQRSGTNGSTNRILSGGGILRRLNLAPQPLAPTLDLVDSTGSTVANNAVLLGELTSSIIAPAPAPATIELNDTPPPPPANLTESTVLEFPIILTSRRPRVTQGMQAQSSPSSHEQSNQRRASQTQLPQHLVLQQSSLPSPISQLQQQQPHVLRVPRRQGSIAGGTAMYSPGPDGDDGQGYYHTITTVVPSSVTSSSTLSVSFPTQTSIPTTPLPAAAGMVTPTETFLPSHPPPTNNIGSGNTNSTDSYGTPAPQHSLHHNRLPPRSGISAGLQAAAEAAAAVAATNSPDISEEPEVLMVSNSPMDEEDDLPTYEDVINNDLQQDIGDSSSISFSWRSGSIDMIGRRQRQPSLATSSYSYQPTPPAGSSVLSMSFQNPRGSFSPGSLASSNTVHSHYYQQYSPPTTQDPLLASSLPPSSVARILSSSPAAPAANIGVRSGNHIRTNSTASDLATSSTFVTHLPTSQPLQQQPPPPQQQQQQSSLHRHASLSHITHGASIHNGGGGVAVRSSTAIMPGSVHTRHRRQTSVSGGGTTISSIMIESLASYGGYLSQVHPSPLATVPVSRSLPVASHFITLDAAVTTATPSVFAVPAIGSSDHVGADGLPPRYHPTSSVVTSPM